MAVAVAPIVERTLGRTGARVLPVSLGGEGILRTTGRAREAVPVILEALRLGVRYCDTAPAYQQSQDYYGEAFRAAGPGARDRVFLASKTHERSRDRALRLLDDSLRRLGTDRLDLWQTAHPRELDEVDAACRRDGAPGAWLAPQGWPGAALHRSHWPGTTIRASCSRRCAVSSASVLVMIDPADAITPSCRLRSARRDARIGVVGMKALAAGRLLQDVGAAELLRYTASIADTVIVGCSTVDEVRTNLAVARDFAPMTDDERGALEARVARTADQYDYFKG